MITTEPNITEMKKSISNAGGLFYQYRPCRRDVSTIYDIENIKHGVAYAQTPLNMNDPFDSMAGFSPEMFYNNCLSMIMDALPINDQNQKLLIMELIKSKILGKTGEFLFKLNELKKYLHHRQLIMHKTNIPFATFIAQNSNVLYSKCPRSISEYFHKDAFVIFSLIVGKMDKVDVTEENLTEMFKLDDLLDELYKKAIDIRDSIYIPTMQSFLNKLTVSCFSSSGWDNQLMWSHYANSYSGICIEYDFTKIKEFIGFIYPVEYTDQRPTLTLQDMGIKAFSLNTEEKIERSEPDMMAIFSYLLAKNTCWEYEKEWRIINIGEPNTPIFIDLPFIKSITFGINMDPICKHLLWDVCKNKDIECYQIVISAEKYELNRKLLTDDDFEYDIDAEVVYINTLNQQVLEISKRMQIYNENIEGTDENADFSHMRPMLSNAMDMLINAYFLKLSLNRMCDNTDEDLSGFVMPDEIIGGVFQINQFVEQVKELTSSLSDVISPLHMVGKINSKDYPIIKKHLADLSELTEKFERIDWNSIYLN